MRDLTESLVATRTIARRKEARVGFLVRAEDVHREDAVLLDRLAAAGAVGYADQYERWIKRYGRERVGGQAIGVVGTLCGHHRDPRCEGTQRRAEVASTECLLGGHLVHVLTALPAVRSAVGNDPGAPE